MPGLQFNAHLTHPGDIVFEHACKLGLEGIVSKRLGSLITQADRRTGSSSRTRRHLQSGGRLKRTGAGVAGDDYPHPAPHP